MLLDSLSIDPAALEARTGWAIKPEGACKGDVCVPLPRGEGEPVDARVLAERLGMPLVQHEAAGPWSLGPEVAGRALSQVEAPDLTLPDLNGAAFQLSLLRGKKVVLVAWASW